MQTAEATIRLRGIPCRRRRARRTTPHMRLPQRALKRKMQREGIFREMRRRKAYEKPCERRTREKAEAIRRVRKAARKQAQRDGLIPMPKRREDARRSVAWPRSF